MDAKGGTSRSGGRMLHKPNNIITVPNAIKTVTTVVGQMPTLIKNLSEAEKAVTKELEEQGNTRGSQELTIGDMGL